MTINEITNEALALPSQTKGLLVNRLIESLDDEGNDLHGLWRAEVKRRSDDVRNGRAKLKLFPGPAAIEKIRMFFAQ